MRQRYQQNDTTDHDHASDRLGTVHGFKQCGEEQHSIQKLNGGPLILRMWATIYRATPQLVKIPFTQVDITFSLLSFLFLHIIRVITTPIMVNTYGWPANHKLTNEAVASVVSMFHAALLVPSLYVCLRTQPYRPSAKFSESPSWWNDAAKALILLCNGYMIQDTLFGVFLANYTPGHGIKITSDQIPFIAHHVITVSYMLSTIVVEAGHISAMILMFLGEFTNPMFNSYLMAVSTVNLDFCCGMSEALFQPIAAINAFFYILFRAIISPPFILHLGYDLILTKEGRKNLPLPLSIYFFTCGLIVLYGSVPWIADAWGLLKDTFHGKSILYRL